MRDSIHQSFSQLCADICGIFGGIGAGNGRFALQAVTKRNSLHLNMAESRHACVYFERQTYIPDRSKDILDCRQAWKMFCNVTEPMRYAFHIEFEN